MVCRKLLTFFFFTALSFSSAVKAEEEGKGAGALFVKLPIFVIPVIQERDLKALYSINMILEVADNKVVDQAQKKNPVLIDRIYTDLYSLLSIVWDPELHIPLKDIKQRLQKICDRVLGENAVKAVLIQDFSRQIVN